MKRTWQGWALVPAVVAIAACSSDGRFGNVDDERAAGTPRTAAAKAEHAPPAATSKAATKPFHFDASASGSTAASAATCALPGFSLPAGARIYAAGAYAGVPTDIQIDDSGHQATSIRVAVNETAAPVVLVLGAYEPTIWSVGWTRGTSIAGVLLTGYHRQQVTGLAPTVPVLVSTYDNRGPCGYAYVGGDGSSRLNAVARAAFGRPVDTAFVAQKGHVNVGAPSGSAALVTDASAREVSEFRRKGAPLAGKGGLDAAVAAGTLRPATQADAEEWARVQRAHAGPEDVPPIVGASARRVSAPYNGYVVLRPFQIPAGLYGAHSATFFVARGVPLPTGNPGHSRVLDLNTGRCAGATCGLGD